MPTRVEKFYSEVVSVYDRLGYEMMELPKVSVEERVAPIAEHLR